MSAECSLALTAIEPTNIKIETNKNGKTPYARIKYSDSILQLDPFSIVTPSLPILAYDFSKGRIDIDLAADEASLAKFKSLQETIIQLLHSQQYEWFQTHSMTIDAIKERFQPFLQGTVLSIYLSSLLRTGKPIWVWKGGNWSNVLKQSSLQAGKSVRLVLRLTGIQSFFSLGVQNIPKNMKCHIVMHPLVILLLN